MTHNRIIFIYRVYGFVKFTGEQNLLHFAHKDDMFNDYTFTMAYYLALQGDGSLVNIFPTFEAFCLDDSEKSDSKMTGAFC